MEEIQALGPHSLEAPGLTVPPKRRKGKPPGGTFSSKNAEAWGSQRRAHGLRRMGPVKYRQRRGHTAQPAHQGPPCWGRNPVHRPKNLNNMPTQNKNTPMPRVDDPTGRQPPSAQLLLLDGSAEPDQHPKCLTQLNSKPITSQRTKTRIQEPSAGPKRLIRPRNRAAANNPSSHPGAGDENRSGEKDKSGSTCRPPADSGPYRPARATETQCRPTPSQDHSQGAQSPQKPT